ncbi:tripartite tricarboxylate transporter substrate binding protein [Bradyrhizobium sp. LHD-71]|uniref:Bug family tripartite tricarboxylate transporter substrate binding protein n=1 Tax=Bradyrhizobium sp. LHD-71 TaxID=3072141 RepID=UPI00280D4238|nr:tripartite tricarboxylate transporter substrate binding protein [Bradyrhizobium sp. LHD-71]MDQ8726127.1 tripartite tricarboxylate transporter substrate binding protein [Bradyrhizobium sp. LHD-71]
MDEHTPSRRSLLRALGWLAMAGALPASLASTASPAVAQGYPNKPVLLVVPFATGGGSDIVARLIAEPLTKALGQPVVIENKPGAGATVGATAVAKAPPDGYTLLYTTPGVQITNPYLMPSLPYDADKDLVPVALIALAINVLVVNPALPVKTISELIAWAKANPGKLNFSSSGIGASSHLSGELFKQRAGIEIEHVPYRGTGPSIQDLLTGRIQMTIDTVSTLLPHIRSGGLRAIAVASETRNPALPDVPTIADTLPGFEGSSINYISVPAGTPQPIIDRLNREINAIVGREDIAKRMVELGIAAATESPSDLARRIQSEQVKWKAVIEKISTQ